MTSPRITFGGGGGGGHQNLVTSPKNLVGWEGHHLAVTSPKSKGGGGWAYKI